LIESQFSGHALIVTVECNDDIRYPNLGNQVKVDGTAIKSVLLDPDFCGYNENNINHLSGQNCRLEDIKAAIISAASKVHEDDPFLLYYSGHGEADGLVPSDANKDDHSNLLLSSELSKLLKTIPSKRKLILLDACYSGSIELSGAKAKGSQGPGPGDDRFKEMASGEGVVVISSSRDTERSWILKGDTTSLFTKYVISGLRGGDGHDAEGFVRVFDLFNHITVGVRAERPDQAPVYAAYHLDSNFAVAFCGEPQKRIKGVNEFSLLKGDSEINQLFVNVMSRLYPLGPTDREVWIRANGDLSKLKISDNGRTQWFRAGKDIDRGVGVRYLDIIDVALEDYPFNRELGRLKESLST